MRAKLVWFNENAEEYRALLPDLQQLISRRSTTSSWW